MSEAPYFEDLSIGSVERGAPAVTLTSGLAAVHQSIVGDRLALSLDATLAARVLGLDGSRTMAHPALVWDIAIGQSTLLTRRVIANLFYRGLVLKRFPVLGDTLSTTTEVVGLRPTRSRPGSPPRGLAVLRVRTTDQAQREVLNFWRCAMLPAHGQGDLSGSAAAAPDPSFAEIPAAVTSEALRAAVSGWELAALAPASGVAAGHAPAELIPGARWRVDGGDVVSAAPELARLSLNVAFVHHDRGAGADGRRLVYGGHTIGLAAAQAVRMLPRIVTILGWDSCDHPAPVAEGDTLSSVLELERIEAYGELAWIAHLRSRVSATREPSEAPSEVLDWRFAALIV
ncbi:MAG: MaoC family dehydratase [Solirubrobacteraceae bacterium]